MEKRIVWLAVACGMVAVLLLASCAPATSTPRPTLTPTPTATPTPTSSGPEMVNVRAVKRDGTVVENMVEKPKYGGTLTFIFNRLPTGFDDCYTKTPECRANPLIYNEIFDGDWAKGPAGTGEADWLYGGMPDLDLLAGYLVESWELTDPVTFTFHVRKGVHFQDKPPVSGREMTADDIVYSVKRNWSNPTSFLRTSTPWGFEITAPDKWTVVIKSPGEQYVAAISQFVTGTCYIVPHEAVEKYGDLRLWENACGTGPFMLVDYVSGSSFTFERNPNYFLKDPLLPENQLPYVDRVRELLILDVSTQLAAIRTDKADQIGGFAAVSWEDAASIIETNPKLKYLRSMDANVHIMCMQTDKTELPFKDVRVRQALSMAIDFKGIVRDYYEGNAEIISFPVAPLRDTSNYYVPLEKLPASVQELYSGNPEKAKKLLVEAGYPNGFKTEIVCSSIYIDRLSIVKDYWSKIGVDLKLDVREESVWTTIKAARGYKEMYVNSRSFATPFAMQDFLPGNQLNLSGINDPRTNEVYEAVSRNFFNQPERDRVFREWLPYYLEQAWYIQLPHAYLYTFWEPWVKNYHGEDSVGYSSRLNWVQFVWIDQELKKEMVGRK